MPVAETEPGMSRGTATVAPASPSQPSGERAVSVLWSFGKCLGALLPVYLAGYYGFSITVIVFGLMIYMGWKHSRQEKAIRVKSAMYLLENEREFTTEKVFKTKRDLPPWVRACIHTSSWLTVCHSHSLQLESHVTSVTPVRFNLSWICATLHRSEVSAYKSLLDLYLFKNFLEWAQSSAFSSSLRLAPYLEIPNVQCLGNRSEPLPQWGMWINMSDEIFVVKRWK